METWIKDFFVHNKSLNARWSTKWSWILSLYHLINRLNKQDFTLSILNLHWAFTLDKKWRWNQTYTAVKNHYSGIWQAETCIQSLLRHRYRFNTNFLNARGNCNCIVFSTFSTFSLQSLKNQLSDKAYSKLLKFEILALACVLETEIDTFTKIARVWIQPAWTEKSCLSKMDYREQHEIAVNSMDINTPWSLSLWFIQNRNHITSGAGKC